MTNSIYLHFEDIKKKMVLVCCGSSPGPLLIEGNNSHTPPHSHILGVETECDTLMKLILTEVLYVD